MNEVNARRSGPVSTWIKLDGDRLRAGIQGCRIGMGFKNPGFLGFKNHKKLKSPI